MKYLMALLVFLLCGCSGGGDNITAISPDTLPALEVKKPESVYVSCILDIQCRITWHRDFIDDFTAVIYRNTADNFDTAAEIGREDFFSSYTDTNVVAGTRYYYWVVFEDSSGARGPVSDSAFNSQCVVSLTVTSCAPPSEPDTQTGKRDTEPKRNPLPFLREVSDTHYQAVKQPLLATEARQAPVYHDGTHLFVGIDQGADSMADMETAGSSQSSSIETVVTPSGTYQTSVTKTTRTTLSKRGTFDVRHGYFDMKQGRGGAAESLESYLRETAEVQRAGIPSVLRFTTSPVVRFGGTATAADVDRLVGAVQLVNAALPLEWRLQVPLGLPTPETQDGIYVEFVPEARYSDDSLGKAELSYNRLDGAIRYATITINKAYRMHGARGAVGVLAHELIHALGIAGHVSANFRSIMPDDLDLSQQTPLSLLYPIDRAALRVLYSRMEPGDAVTDFGTWTDTSWHLHAHDEQVAFGATWRNGYGEPWAYGYLPETDLADNPALTGRASWIGFLLGFTPEAAPVAGDARLGINLSDLTGTAFFSRLESWAAGEAPGNAGTGARWGRGSLFYAIAVTGNTFRQTGGDDGFLTGAFFGEAHEGMGGTLEREDLTAAFGGTRNISVQP